MKTKINHVTARLGAIPYITRVEAGNHIIVADEPVDLGGTDEGPKPHDILLSALASCSCITIRMYADRKGWELKQVECDATMQREITSGKQKTKIHQQFTFSGNLSEEQKGRLIEIGGKCPVHKTLSAAIQIESSLKNNS